MAEIDGRAIRWEDIRSRVVESAAPEALRKLILERRLETMCAQQGVEVGEPEYAVEREQIERSMIGAGLALDSADAGRMLERVRRERGLGTVRYESLIRTNAMLRALVSESAEPDEPELRRGYDALYGPRLRVRLITAGSFDEATRLVRLARDGTDFAELAVRFSADPSAARGGLLEAMSVHDESYPLAVRAAAKELQAGGGAGAVSGVIALENGFAILKLERVVPAPEDAPSFESLRAQLRDDVRLRRERILMNELAGRLLPGAGELRIFDEEIRHAWRRARSSIPARR